MMVVVTGDVGMACEILIEIQRSLLVLSFVENGLSHTIDILWPFSLALLQVDITDYFTPASLLIQLALFLSDLLLFLQVVFRPLPFLVLFSFPELFELSASVCAALLFDLPFFFLDRERGYAFFPEGVLDSLFFFSNFASDFVFFKVIEFVVIVVICGGRGLCWLVVELLVVETRVGGQFG